MRTNISIGDTLNCLFCEKDFILEHIDFDSEKEYVKCPHCNKSADIHKYHFDTRGIDIDSLMIKCTESILSVKQKGSKCKECLFWEFENGGRGDFCLKNGEIDNGAERLCEITFYSPLHNLSVYMNKEQRKQMNENMKKADKCIDYINKEKCLKAIRKNKR